MIIAVYAAWREGSSRENRLAQDVGREIAVRQHQMVFGGGDLGPMGVVARAAKDHGARVTAVTLPQWQVPADESWDELILTETLGERKTIMDTRADAILILPGRTGTVAEMFVSIEHADGARPMVVVDPWGYYDGLLEWMRNTLIPQHLPVRALDARRAVALAEGRIPVR